MEREEGQESIAGDAIQIAPVFNGEVEELLNGQNGFAWVVTLFKHENLELAKVVTFDENALDSELQALNCMQVHSVNPWMQRFQRTQQMDIL